MKIVKLAVLMIALAKSGYSQKVVLYHYFLNERIGSNKIKSDLLGIDLEFSTKRKYYSREIFSETRLFTGDAEKAIFYRIKNGVWYYKSHGKWNLFYDYLGKQGGVISLSGIRYRISFLKQVNIRNQTLHKIILKPIDISQSHNLKYFLSLQKGVVIIQSANGSLVLRSDSFENSLTDDEIAIL
jgi:hypothetical protein